MTPSTNAGGARNPLDPDYAAGGAAGPPARPSSGKAPLAPPFFASQPSQAEPRADAPPQEEWSGGDSGFPWEEDQQGDEMLLTDMVETEAAQDYGFDAPEQEYGFETSIQDDYGAQEPVQDYGYEASLGEFDLEAPDQAFGFEASVEETDNAGVARAGDVVDALASRLEALAHDLRQAGAAGVARHAGGDDPLGAVLAAVIAGYLAGRHDPGR